MFALFAGLLIGCDGSTPTPSGTSGRGPIGRGPGNRRAAPGAEPAAPIPQAPRDRRSGAASGSMPSLAAAPPPSATAPSGGPGGTGGPSGPADDPAPEALRRAFGAPSHCISAETRERLTNRLSIRVQAAVMGSGRVTRASVSAGGLSATDLECMRRHAESLSLGITVENAPRTVTAVVVYDVRSTPGEEREVVPQAPPIPGQVAPDRTLPALADGSPSGQVAPGITLEPGGTASARPGGFVPPSSTLPAQVP